MHGAQVFALPLKIIHSDLREHSRFSLCDADLKEYGKMWLIITEYIAHFRFLLFLMKKIFL